MPLAPRKALEIDSVELSEYIRAVLQGINTGVSQDFHLFGNIKFSIGLRNVIDKEGRLKITVAGIGMGKTKEENSTIEFEISDTGDWLLRLAERHNQVFTEPDRKKFMELVKLALEAEKVRLGQGGTKSNE